CAAAVDRRSASSFTTRNESRTRAMSMHGRMCPEVAMRSRLLLLAPILCGLIALSPHAQAPDGSALTGIVTGPSDDGPLEGVLVGAKKSGSTITTTVATDRTGRYRFPQSRLEPGQYALRIAAVGYEVEAPATADVTARATATVDLKLRKARDVAAQ